MKLVFSGIQGCGKGTQARVLTEKYGFSLIEMGQCLREIGKSSSDLGKKVKETIDAGKLLSPEIVCEIIKDVLKNIKNENIILDGFIRNDGNKKCVEEIIPDYKVVFFELSKEKAIDRLLGRMYNPKTGETFPSNVLKDPKTGDELIKRIDDNKDSILKRIDEFVTKTLPTIEKQKKEARVLIVNADQSIEKVSKQMLELLGL